MRAIESRRVLVIEDDADTRANLSDILDLDGYQAVQAATAAEALDREDWSCFDAILLDRKLPDGDAEELLPRLKRLAPKAAVIILTGYGDLDSAIAALRLGADDYILKPINPDALRASVARLAKLRRAQESALQAERLAAIGQMVAGLAHESRNALQRAQACLDMLQMVVEDQPEALDLVQRVQDAQNHLHHLYEQVREYAAPINLDRQVCDLLQVWHSTRHELEPALRQKSIELCEEFDSVDSRCVCDPFALGQVFRNILENAIDASPDCGRIRVCCQPAEIDGGPAVRLAVRDNGPGIPAAVKERIFEPFFTTKTRGTGLGMAIARRMIEAHGGHIAVGGDSSPGAEFSVCLPRGME